MRKPLLLTAIFLSAGLLQLFFGTANSVTSRLASAATPMKTSTSNQEFKVVGYVQHYNLERLSPDLDRSKITHINIAFLHPDANGKMMMADDNAPLGDDKINSIRQFIQKMHAKRVKVLVSIGGGAVSEPKSGSKAAAIKENYLKLLANKKSRTKFAGALVEYLDKMNFDGVDIDFEGPFLIELNAPKDNLFSLFIEQLRKKLPPRKILTSALKKDYGGESVPRETLAKFDWINVMAYDFTGNWEDSKIGQHSSLEDAATELEFWRGQVEKEKLVLGVPFYGVGFDALKRDNHYSYREIVAKFPDRSEADTAGNVIYYNGISTIGKKVELASETAAGIMIWELPQDAEGEKSLLAAIRDKSKELKLR